jgi:hypothetical protein
LFEEVKQTQPQSFKDKGNRVHEIQTPEVKQDDTNRDMNQNNKKPSFQSEDSVNSPTRKSIRKY